MIRILAIGKPSGIWYNLGKEYLGRLPRHWKVSCSYIKDASSSLSIEQRKKEETIRLLESLSQQSYLIELHPEGNVYTSQDFAQYLQRCCENRVKEPTFCIAGTFGFARNLLPQQRDILSLSPMTFTHEMTFSLISEQLYRAYTIINKLPYHY